MRIDIQSLHFDADKKLLEVIEGKLNKLTKYSDDIIGAEVVLKLEKDSNKDNKVVETRLIIPGNDLFAKRNSDKFEKAIDEVSEALRRQLKKHKEKINAVK
ncbi:MAG: ribosome-associated translation inhibitor RaiA [Bacteroidetes bacterium]|nr:MAG: ribosome-associated translation inhibitor RaiA [Bacteroidota bacterium]